MLKEKNFSVSLLTKEKQKAYKKFTERNKKFLWYSSLAYKSLFEEYLKLSSQYIIVENEEMIVGCLPLFFSSNSKYGKVINSLPFYGSNGSFLLDEKLTPEQTYEVANYILIELNQIIKNDNIAAITLITSPFDDFSNSFLEKNFSSDYIDFRNGQITPLPSDRDKLIKIFHNPRPRNIRKAINSGITIREGSRKLDFDFLAHTHQQNMIKIGGKFKETRFFDLVREGYASNTYKLFIAELDGKSIAALLVFYFNNNIEYFTPCTLENFRKLQPSSLLIYQAMKEAIDNGYRFWNWGGTWETQTGVFDFKKKWGAIDEKYYYHTRLLNKNILSCTPKEIEQTFPHFYTIPYNQLN